MRHFTFYSFSRLGFVVGVYEIAKGVTRRQACPRGHVRNREIEREREKEKREKRDKVLESTGFYASCSRAKLKLKEEERKKEKQRKDRAVS